MVMHHEITYDGVIYTYEPWEDIEPGENCKIFHDVYEIEQNIQGDKVGKKSLNPMPLSPYSHPSKAEFSLWVWCGMPTREDINKKLNTNGNASTDDIRKYYEMWLDDKIDKEILGGQYD